MSTQTTYSVVTGESFADMLAAEFCIVYTGTGNQVHANDCGGRRVKFGQHRTEAFPGALRQGFTMAPCCTAHESRLNRLARQAGTW